MKTKLKFKAGDMITVDSKEELIEHQKWGIDVLQLDVIRDSMADKYEVEEISDGGIIRTVEYPQFYIPQEVAKLWIEEKQQT
jgi:hypothetical protein